MIKISRPTYESQTVKAKCKADQAKCKGDITEIEE